MFSDRLQETRREKGWTQEELAKISGIGVATIRRYETNQRTPKETSSALKVLAETLGVYPHWLLTGNGFKTHREELLSQIEEDENKKEMAAAFYRIKLKLNLYTTIQKIYYPNLPNEIYPKKLLNSDNKDIVSTLDVLSDKESALVTNYVEMERKMFEDIDNYIAIRTQRFIKEIKEG